MSSRLAVALVFAALLAAAAPARADTVLSLNGSAELSVAGDALDNRLTLTFTDIAPSGWVTAVIVEDNPDGRLTAGAGSSCEVDGEGRRATCGPFRYGTLRGGPGDDTLALALPDGFPTFGLMGDDGADRLSYVTLPPFPTQPPAYRGFPGSRVLHGGPGDDELRGGSVNDLLSGGAGADLLIGGSGNDVVTFDRGGVAISNDGVADDGRPGERDNVAADIENIFGTDGDDRIVVSPLTSGGTPRVEARGGDDQIVGSDLADDLRGDAGDDRLEGRGGPDVLVDGDGTNVFDGGPGDDRLSLALRGAGDLHGGSGFDRVSTVIAQPAALRVSLDDVADDAGVSNVHSDVEAVEAFGVVGQPATVTVLGSAADNRITTDFSPDTVDPGGGEDVVHTGALDDTVRARDGRRDRIDCGDGRDAAVVDEFDSVRRCEGVDRADVARPRLTSVRATSVVRGVHVIVRVSERVTLRARLSDGAGRVLVQRILHRSAGRVRLTLRARPRRPLPARLTLVATDRAGKRATVSRVVRIHP